MPDLALGRRAPPGCRRCPRSACSGRRGAGSRGRCGPCRAARASPRPRCGCSPGCCRALRGRPPACETRPNFVASTTSSRRSLDRPADELLVGVRAVDLGGVDVGDAEVERAVDGADRLGVGAARIEVVAGHRHRAESDARDVEFADRDVLHGLLRSGCGAVGTEIQESTHFHKVRVLVDGGTGRVPRRLHARSYPDLVDAKSEIREFLTSRRAKLTPDDVGLTSYGPRRVPGLRREEVAVLAGVSVPYYTRLERGNLQRGLRERSGSAGPRSGARRRRAGASLRPRTRGPAGQPRRAGVRERQRIRPSVQRMLDAITGAPAAVLNGRLDMLGDERARPGLCSRSCTSTRYGR